MRLGSAVLPVAAAAFMWAGPVAAGVPGMVGGGGGPSPVRTQPLAPGEVLLETGGVGLVVSRADLATLSVMVSSGGDTPEAARRANEAEVRGVVAAARRAGVPADAIETREGQPGDLVMTTFDMVAAGSPGETATHQAQSTITIALRDVDRVGAVRAALVAARADVSGPIYSLTDRTAARREAQRRALAAARADAEAYAAHTGMRLARVVRISERLGADLYGLAMNNEALFRGLQNIGNPGQPQTEPDIPTFVMVGVDYALAPQ